MEKIDFKLEVLRTSVEEWLDSWRMFNIWIMELEKGIKAKRKARMGEILREARYWLNSMEQIGCISNKTYKHGVWLINEVSKAVNEKKWKKAKAIAEYGINGRWLETVESLNDKIVVDMSIHLIRRFQEKLKAIK